MAKPTCDFELNRQLKILKSRIDQTDKNVTSLFMANSELVKSLLADPLTMSGVGPIAEAIYATGEAGWALMVELFDKLSLPTIKELTMMLAMQIAQQLVDAIAQILDQMLSQALAVINQVLDQIASIIQMIKDLEQQLIDAAKELRDRILNQIKALNATLKALKATLASQEELTGVIGDFLGSHINISNCTVSNLKIS